MTPDKLPEEITDQINSEADLYGFVVPYDGSNTFYIEDKVKGYQAGATAWAGWKVRHDELMKEHADLILALAAMLNGYQNLPIDQKDWFTVPKDLIDCYTKMVLEYDKAIKILNDGK